ncbi:hypothetical protein [Raoultella ornithinolytica]|uniref:hypothetical protein n=1 Tax=Raoultella ornithinolytica TaxID=54291 RepID=UPI00388DB661
MNAAEKWDDDAFIQLMTEAITASEQGDEVPVDLATERMNQVISWEEFAGNFS